MSETTSRLMTVKQARRLLSDVRGKTSEQIAEAEELLRALHAKRPGLMPNGGTCVVLCQNCGNGTRSLHSDVDTEVWGCGRCHREPMSDEQARALKAARREQADRLAAEKAAEEAAAPKPREVLTTTATELTGVRAEQARLKAAAASAHAAVANARVALDNAEAALAQARNRIAEAAVDALLDPMTGKKAKNLAAEAAAVEAARSGLELATSACQTIEDMLTDVGYQMRRLEKRHREAALTVLANEVAPLLIARAAEARNEFIAASKGLVWLEKSGAAPSSLIVAELRWSWHNSPETWRAGSQPGPDLDAALAELLADSRAPVSVKSWRRGRIGE